jgi:hypothetical protein
MKQRKRPSLTAIFQNCLERGCTPEQLQDFLDRARRQHMDNPEMIRIIDELEIINLTSVAT